MDKREKVIKAWENVLSSDPSDATWGLIDDTLALLKEQEPIAPVMVSHSRGFAYNCGACGTEIAVIRDTVSAGWAKENVRYCQKCGRAVKWE